MNAIRHSFGRVLWALTFAALLGLTLSEANAQLFQIINRTTYGITPGSIQDQALDALENQVNSQNLPDADSSSYLDGMSDAGVITQKGMGADYASNPTLFVVGAALGVGVDVGNNSFGDLVSGDVDSNQMKGVGIGGNVLAGVNLGLFKDELWIFDLHRMNLYVNFIKLDLPIKKDGFDGDLSSFGAHLQYKILEPRSFGLGLFHWGGVDITTGFETSGMNLTYTKDITETVESSGITGSFAGTAKIEIDNSNYSIPIEVSTNARLLYFLTLYGGLGADLAWGETTGSASVTGPVNIDGIGTAGEASLNIGDKGSPSAFLLRGFAGLQFNITLAKIYLHLNRAFTEDTVGLNLGFRVAW